MIKDRRIICFLWFHWYVYNIGMPSFNHTLIIAVLCGAIVENASPKSSKTSKLGREVS